MAQQALVDTTVLYAAGNRSEQRWHETALSIVQSADAGDLPVLVVPDVVLVETMNGLKRDVGPPLALDMLNRLEAGARFVLSREPRGVWESGLDAFRRSDRLSLADAVQVATARHRGIEYIYSFDAGFDGVEGLSRLASPVNPFAP